MVTLDTAIREFTPVEGDWRPLEILIERAFSGPEPKSYYGAIFALFERFPEEDGAGVFWSALHGMEATGDYEELLLQRFRQHPSLMTTTMLRRIKKVDRASLVRPNFHRLSHHEEEAGEPVETANEHSCHVPC